MNVLNLYAGVGGNRKLWKDVKVTAIENYQPIADVYRKLYPGDKVIVCDAHQYLLENYMNFDFIWSSPPCPTHSRMQKATRHPDKKYPDMSLYQQIIFLQHFFKGKWVVENVKPYYDFLIRPTNTIGRHCFWSSGRVLANDIERPKGFIVNSTMDGKKKLHDWLDIHFEEVIYYKGNHCPAQILRNCVHPRLGLQIFNSVNGTPNKIELEEAQTTLF